MKHLLILLHVLTVCNSIAQQANELQFIDISNDIIVPNHYVVSKSKFPILIDGKDSDKAWKNIPFTNSFGDIADGESPRYETKVKMLWNDEYLMVYAEMMEPHIWADITKRDEVIFYNNDFEVFIDPSSDTKNYAEIEINALNTVWDLLLDKPYRVGGKANNEWNLNELKSAVNIEGTINDPSDTDIKWSVEMAIPMKALLTLKNKPRKTPVNGESWRINFSRVQWQHEIVDGKYKRKFVKNNSMGEDNWSWTNQKAINMHAPEMWGYLFFSDSAIADQSLFKPDQDVLIEQSAYALFRKIRFGDLKQLTTYHQGFKKELKILYSGKKTLTAHFFKTNKGFELSIQSPKSGKTYLINEMGDLSVNQNKNPLFTFATWAHGDKVFDKEKWNDKLDNYKSIGISEVLVGGSPEFLQPLIELAGQKDIKIHAWMWTLNRPNDSTCMQHPDWYAVNRKGENSLDYRAYVDYYQWLSPFHPEARNYIKSNVEKLTQLQGLASIHLDYVRYVDVILGAQLQPKYGLVQDHEMPEYDYGYHPIAREQFKAKFGYDPLDLDNPELSAEWRQFRLDAITTLVNECVAIAHSKNIKMTAAVFPYPEMSRHMVRQAWDDWNLDAAFPMLYQNFYNESTVWIGFATKTDVQKVDFPIYSGLYIPGLSKNEDLEDAIRQAYNNGASGVSIFEADNLNEEQKGIIKRLYKEFNKNL
ncbi:family 10 glycosylhydrolase [Paracrocinitomix mangrovi]|uniref:family 10 glycosylhydrolase n=1 Tax=Paracrocinitomix mangrovi TaxID=2862509 RepID=UPI001C8D8697|nr:family 10 glycosylhydrolase [Paracrocinitomix mangrovi]UKN01466.1 family 10 glycosylhydrolase [Paracrocinitomix mangrovi]